MAIEVKVPKDIKEYKEKIIAGMNLKQLLCLTIAGGVNILISLIFVVWLKIPMEITSWLMILVSIPIVSFCWFKRNGLNFETYIKYLFKYHLSAGVRKKKEAEPKDKNEQTKLGGQET
ncbi:hypothetical protein IGI47_000344 [Enterococcus sp. AZ191]|uniref:PrgI family protein n=1 Tax=Enterococcus sp. AZ191 TaxID=2774639 RepID=UPI003F27CAFA